MRIDEIERTDEILPAVAGIAARAVAGLAGKVAKTVGKVAGGVAKGVASGAATTAATIGSTVGKAVGRRIGAGRNPVQDRGTGSAFSGNPPKKSLGSIGAMPGAKTSSVGSTDRPGTTGTIGTTPTQSAADMRDSASNEIDTGSTYSTGTPDMQNTQSNNVEPDELKTGDTLTVKVEPGNKNVKLVYPDETEAEVPRELLRLQQLAGMQ